MKKKKISLIFLSLVALSTSVYSCGTDPAVFTVQKAERPFEISKDILIEKPLVITMPSVNYNERPDKTKIDTIIIHHTAPFPSLTRVGYFFQDINSRVSAHYTVGKEGLIIQSVDDNDRAWHAGASSWLGKYNVNDYSIGIEILNDGDSKDPFTEPQYDSLSQLVAYLMKTYDVSISRVIGHRDIGIPMGRKIDPADNFDWKAFKARVKMYLKQRQSFWGWGDLPQDGNISVNKVFTLLSSSSISEKSLGVDSLLTIPHKTVAGKIKEVFEKESFPDVKVKFFRLFEVDENRDYIGPARKILGNYKNESPVLTSAAVNYLNALDKENSFELFMKTYQDKELSDDVKISLIKVISNYRNEIGSKILIDELRNVSIPEIKKVIIVRATNAITNNTKNLI